MLIQRQDKPKRPFVTYPHGYPIILPGQNGIVLPDLIPVDPDLKAVQGSERDALAIGLHGRQYIRQPGPHAGRDRTLLMKFEQADRL